MGTAVAQSDLDLVVIGDTDPPPYAARALIARLRRPRTDGVAIDAAWHDAPAARTGARGETRRFWRLTVAHGLPLVGSPADVFGEALAAELDAPLDDPVARAYHAWNKLEGARRELGALARVVGAAPTAIVDDRRWRFESVDGVHARVTVKRAIAAVEIAMLGRKGRADVWESTRWLCSIVGSPPPSRRLLAIIAEPCRFSPRDPREVEWAFVELGAIVDATAAWLNRAVAPWMRCAP